MTNLAITHTRGENMRSTNRTEMKLLLSLRNFITGDFEAYKEWEQIWTHGDKEKAKLHNNYEPYSAWFIISRWVGQNLYPKKKNISSWTDDGFRIETDNPRSLYSLLQEYTGDAFYEEMYGRFVQIANGNDVLKVFKKLGEPPIRTALSGRIKEQYYMDEGYRLKFRELIRLATITSEEEAQDNPPTPPPSDGDDRLKRKMPKRR